MSEQFLKSLARDLRIHASGLTHRADETRKQIETAAAFLDALSMMATDEDYCVDVWNATYGTWAEYGARDEEAGEAAINAVIYNARAIIAEGKSDEAR